VTDPALQRKPDVMAALASGLERVRDTLRDVVRAAREKFAGPVTYAAAPWETVDWEPFDLVSVDAYRDADSAAGDRETLRAYQSFGKPVAVTEFGCCTYRGAAGRGGMGWMITDENSDPPLIPGTYERDEEEQVRHLRDMLAVYEAEDIDSAFWFTFAGFEQPRHPTDPHRDLDRAALVPALRVAVVERAGRLRHDAEQQSGGIAHDPPEVHQLYAFGAEFFQPGDFSGHVVGVDVQVHPRRAVAQPLDQQPEFPAVERGAVIFGVTLALCQLLADGCAPERQLAVVLGGRHIDHDLGQPAVVRHLANLRHQQRFSAERATVRSDENRTRMTSLEGCD
jgi:hypothetical protein